MKVYIGCSGYYYKDWVGVFYPPRLRREEWIKYYAKHFVVLELNATFYGFPDRGSIKSMLSRVKDLRFSVKVNRLFTHTRNYTQEDVKKFLYGIEPILEEDRLIALLFQFPHTFGYSQENLEYIRRLGRYFSEMEKVVEVRSRSFDRKDFFNFLEEEGFSIVNADAPMSDRYLVGPWVGVGAINYVRLHGRDPQHPYQYLYTLEELKKIKNKIKKLGDRETYIFFNNTDRAKAVFNAFQMKMLWGMEVNIPQHMERFYREKEWEGT